ncbi:Na+-driven multidrug efflux pump [Metamycoplasma subdolum]|uniref:Na+-driven multidrug efflux pump n=1 Tax=Metamycoplasma subdolum TaxID=92407 RepID=A0A3L9ZYX6_9BACT|nr:MATE family efflux transporter [Metamycoplasma subdolum]RMA77567.1 Na+-driven multidrug efflux pump [Metamycoplasma subdolum]WPB50361.1 MATE family efflux transporter [Metamycoplasma subdolum]
MTNIVEKKQRKKIPYLPQNKAEWKLYFLKTFPIVIGEIIFALNGFLDNFMVSHLPFGIDSLTYANTWTSIIYTIFFAIQGIAAMFVGQYWGKKEYSKVNQVMNMRFWLNVIVVFCFVIPIYIIPQDFITIIGGKDINAQALLNGKKYLILITFSWIITCYNFNTNMQLNETGHSKYAFSGAVVTLLTNVIINAVCLYGFKLPAYYAAVGSIISSVCCLISDQLWTWFKVRQIYMSIFKVFKISKPIAIQVLKRTPAMLVTIIAMIMLPCRMFLWARAFPEASIGKKWMAISGVTVLGLVESMASIASAVTGAISSNVSFFVARELGHSNFDEAERNAKQLKGFHALFGFFMSFIMLALMFLIASLPATAKGVEETTREYFENPANLLKIQNEFPGKVIDSNFIHQRMIEAKKVYTDNFLKTMAMVVIVNPLWCWFYTTLAIIRSGGKNNVASGITLLTQGLHFAWLAIISFVIVPRFPNSMTLPLAYMAFYLFDLIRLLIFELVQWKYNWKKNLTIEVDGPFDENGNNLDNKIQEEIKLENSQN